MKILHTIRQGKIGGGETHVLDLVQELNPQEFESVVLAFTDGPLITELKKLGIKTYVIYTEKPFDRSCWEKVKDLLLQEKIDLLHAHGTRAQSNSFWAAHKLHIPIIYTVHGWSFHPRQNRLIKMIRVWSEKFLVKKANVTICVSDHNLSEGKKLFNMDRAVVIKNGINFRKFDADKEYKDLRSELGIDRSVVLIGFIARMTIQKDPFTFIKAIADRPGAPNAKYLMVGDGELKQSAVDLAEKLKVSDKIIFAGFRQDIPDILKALDIYCLPSLWEGLPIGLLEAMAMRKATVSTSVNGTKEVIKPGKNGLLIKAGDVNGLSAALDILIKDEVLRSEIGRNAEQSVKAEYSISKMTRRIEEIYRDLKLK